MKLRQVLTCFFLIVVAKAHGQVSTNAFETFAVKQDSLFVQAYEQKDTVSYHKLLAEFLVEYNKLTVNEQKNYSNYLNGAYYNLCCTYSLLNKKHVALTYLNKAIDAGFMDYKHIQEDTDLDAIRNEQEFLVINTKLRSRADFLYILKNAEKYNNADTRPLPAFTYQSSDNPNLVALRKAFNLDSIVGNGSEVLKIVNLLHWIHNLIPHDGNTENPLVKNAMSMIATCKLENRGLNCRGLATVLNECYLSIGIKSRIVTCLPKDSLKIDKDCHVINAVYSAVLKKWLWIDPTFNAYVMNEHGELLSIEEVRERIIHEKPLVLNPDANWNNKNAQSKDYYLLTYMAKNLYLLECPVNSAYNMETRANGKEISYIQLAPLDYFRQKPDKSEQKDEKSSTTWIIYKTNNAQLFWQAPY